jgi:adenosine deaminase
MREMLNWNPDRLGHVIHVPLEVRQEILKREIGVELCLTCNVLAGMLPRPSAPQDPTSTERDARNTSDRLESGFPDHHFRWWWTSTLGTQHTISLGTDDVGVFLSSSSDEHHLAALHCQLGKDDLKDLTRRAARGAFDKRAIGLIEKRLTDMH